MAYIIAADEIKKTLPGYDPSKSEIFHSKSAKLADKEFEEALKIRSEEMIVIMAGGSASGKTEYVATYLKQEELIVFDGTLPTFEGAKIKIRKALKAGKKVEVHLVLPASLPKAFFAFLNRDRKFSPAHFYRTHSGSRQAVLEIAEQRADITIRVFISDFNAVDLKTMNFEELSPDNTEILVEYLRDRQYTVTDIMNKVARQ